MHKVSWSTTLKIYPVQSANVRLTFDEHVKAHLNKYIADLNGLLLKVDKSSLRLVPPADLSGEYYCSKDGRTCLTRLPPELPCALVRAEALATVFRPRIGLRLEATVNLSKRHFLTCRYDCGDGPISVTVPRPADGKGEFIDEGGAKLAVHPGDKVTLEVVQIVHAAGSLIIKGKLLNVLEHGSALVGGKRKNLTDSEEAAVTEAETVTPLKKKKKKKRLTPLSDDQHPEKTSPDDEEEANKNNVQTTYETLPELPTIVTCEKKKNKKKNKLQSDLADRQQQPGQREKEEEEESDILRETPVKVEPVTDTETTSPSLLNNSHQKHCHRNVTGVALKALPDDCTGEGENRTSAEPRSTYPEAITVKQEPGITSAQEHKPSERDRSPDLLSDSEDSYPDNPKSEGL
ncbi:unnamed protein product [Dibothriocephalus latus]|uniref:Uncharacterized protein n=1 Tax=Dibothriocephalus latus TaxID=60516 RepID=A0A3P7PAU2_DIBLA|nr:unnamed protein product [Dibothriocephalus latus]